MALYALTSAAIQLGTMTNLTDTQIYVLESNSSSFVERINTAASAVGVYILIVRTHPVFQSPCCPRPHIDNLYTKAHITRHFLEPWFDFYAQNGHDSNLRDINIVMRRGVNLQQRRLFTLTKWTRLSQRFKPFVTMLMAALRCFVLVSTSPSSVLIFLIIHR